MKKIKIKIVFLGHIPHAINRDKISNWKSELFEIIKPINTIAISGNSDGDYWEFTDKNIESQLPEKDDADILLAVTNVPLQNNYYLRRLTDNKACLTYEGMAAILSSHNIPLENLLLRILYFVSLTFKHYGGNCPKAVEEIGLIHHETKGCVFDMNGIKADVVFSSNKPQLCHSCVENLTMVSKQKVEKEIIDKIQGELKKIKKGLYYQLSDFIKQNPIFAMIISSIIAITFGIVSSIIAAFIWDNLFS